MTSISSLATAALGLAAALAVAIPVAPAEARTTVTSFALEGGSLSVVPGNGTFSHEAASANLGTVLGEVVVHDTRGSTVGWTAYATATGGAPGGSTVVSYGAGPLTTTGSVTATSQGATQLSSVAVPVVVGTGVTGHNTASWTPTVATTRAGDAGARSWSTVAPSAAPAGTKGADGKLRSEQAVTGTVTHSVL